MLNLTLVVEAGYDIPDLLNQLFNYRSCFSGFAICVRNPKREDVKSGKGNRRSQEILTH